ncbi:hypothetical protein [Nocardioides sp. GXQ0305]|uniref:hypothetical protein n=1 Tax=Nocardioides sp. GXQ0305 TaxID=3423912 RepID=UPI003D7C7572
MTDQAPDILPLLSRGKHRRPKHGACFMEMASVMAGERWSDHPGCTHPVLAELARLVNDNSTDRRRSELAVLVPSVVGLNSPDDDLRWTLGLTAVTASYAVRRVPQSSQRALAAGLLTVQRATEARGLGTVPGTEDVDSALRDVPEEARFARRFSDGRTVSDRLLRGQVAPAVARSAVKGLVTGHQPDPDGDLRRLLQAAIGVAQRLADEDRTRAARQAPDRSATAT